MGINVNEMGKKILKITLKESNINFRAIEKNPIDYVINEQLGVKVRARDRKEKIKGNDSIYIRINELREFEKSCKCYNLHPYICYVEILNEEAEMNIFLFSLEKARKDIKDSGLNVKIEKSLLEINKCIYDGILWRYIIKGVLFINEDFIKSNVQLIYDESKLKLEDNMNINNYNELLNNINYINSLEKLGPTEKEQLVKTRIGHSQLKELLINKDCQCKICGLNDERFLIASHIQRWSVSDDNERRDINNAYLLCPDHDWLFDKFYISFDDDGNILLSDKVDESIYDKLKISGDINKITLNDGNKKYMKWHREQFEKKNNI